jgi:hypothetical protein
LPSKPKRYKLKLVKQLQQFQKHIDYAKILAPYSVSLRPKRQRSRKFDSQNARDEAAKAAKEERKKARESKANRTGTRRTKKQETLAAAS